MLFSCSVTVVVYDVFIDCSFDKMASSGVVNNPAPQLKVFTVLDIRLLVHLVVSLAFDVPFINSLFFSV